MTATKNGTKATRMRGHDRIWLLESRTFLELIEVDPGAAIEDIDTDDFLYRPRLDRQYRTLAYAARHYRHEDGQDDPGWYVWEGADACGPLPTKTQAIREIRGILADYTTQARKD